MILNHLLAMSHCFGLLLVMLAGNAIHLLSSIAGWRLVAGDHRSNGESLESQLGCQLSLLVEISVLKLPEYRHLTHLVDGPGGPSRTSSA